MVFVRVQVVYGNVACGFHIIEKYCRICICSVSYIRITKIAYLALHKTQCAFCLIHDNIYM